MDDASARLSRYVFLQPAHDDALTEDLKCDRPVDERLHVLEREHGFVFLVLASPLLDLAK